MTILGSTPKAPSYRASGIRAPEAFRRVRSPKEARSHRLLGAYSSIDFEYTFSSAQEVMIGCHLPGHWAKGMKATIIVKRP